MTNLVTPNKMVAAVSAIDAGAALTVVQPQAAVTYVRLRATVLVIGENIRVALVDPAYMIDAVTKGVGKVLADAAVAADNLVSTLTRGSELNGVELNGVDLNG